MLKLIVTIVVLIVIIIFSMLNLHMVHIRFFSGDPLQVPVIFLILVSMIVGAMIPIVYNLIKKVNRNRSEYALQSSKDILEEEE